MWVLVVWVVLPAATAAAAVAPAAAAVGAIPAAAVVAPATPSRGAMRTLVLLAMLLLLHGSRRWLPWRPLRAGVGPELHCRNRWWGGLGSQSGPRLGCRCCLGLRRRSCTLLHRRP